jgi:hypothetical protein
MGYEKSITKTLHSQIRPTIRDMRTVIDLAIAEGADIDGATITLQPSHVIVISWWHTEPGDNK